MKIIRKIKSNDSSSYGSDVTQQPSSLEHALELMGGKWKGLLLYALRDGAVRSGELQRSMPGIANKMFVQTARELEEHGLIARQVHPVIPPRVDYTLTADGEALLPIFMLLSQWGKSALEKRKQPEKKGDEHE